MASTFNGSVSNRIQAEKIAESGGAWRLMSFMFFVLAVFLLSYVGLTLGYGKFLEAQIEEVKGEISSLADLVSKEDQDSFLKFQFQLINLKNLLRNHRVSSKFFTLLEANTNRNVQYRSINLDVADTRITIRGVAPSYAVLAEQLAAYDRMAEVTRYQITNSQAAENGLVNFDVTLFFTPTIFASP